VASFERNEEVKADFFIVTDPAGAVRAMESRILREAREAECETLGGLSMLVAQADEQFELWTGAAPPGDVMFEAAQRRLKRR